jgi:hypothetical protein
MFMHELKTLQVTDERARFWYVKWKGEYLEELTESLYKFRTTVERRSIEHPEIRHDEKNIFVIVGQRNEIFDRNRAVSRVGEQLRWG